MIPLASVYALAVGNPCTQLYVAALHGAKGGRERIGFVNPQNLKTVLINPPRAWHPSQVSKCVAVLTGLKLTSSLLGILFEF
jgi:hypothetical protein